MTAAEYLSREAAPVMPDSDVADLARRIIDEQGGTLTSIQVYRLSMLGQSGPGPLTRAAPQTAKVTGEPAI